MLVFDWKIEKGRRFRWAGCTPAETGGQAQGVQTKKERTEYNNESEENGKAEIHKEDGSGNHDCHAGYGGLHWFGVGGSTVLDAHGKLCRNGEHIVCVQCRKDRE